MANSPKTKMNSFFHNLLLLIISLGNIIFTHNGFSQEKELVVLEFDQYMRIVSKEHPLAQRAALQTQKGVAAVQMARGSFDPYLYNDTKQKYLNDNQYYSLIKSGVKIPTWMGVEFQVMNELNQGYYLNPENTMGTDGLWLAGVSVPLGQGFLIDTRRADLRKAQIYEQSTLADQQLMLNELLYDAGKSYWDWYHAYHVKLIFKNAAEVALERLSIIKKEAEIGEKPIIDTIEAAIQLQNLLLNLQQADLHLKNTRALLSIYLWLNGEVPVELDENIIPTPQTSIDEVWKAYIGNEFLVALHPELFQTRLKIDQMKIDYRLTRDQLKPVINFNYNFLNESYLTHIENYSTNNYTWGLNVAMPLFLRKTRGDLKLKSIYLTETQLEMEFKTAALNYKFTAARNERDMLRNQVNLQQKNVTYYNQLFESERTMFAIGESSLFLLNTREQNLISSQVKLIELLAKGLKSELSIDYSSGVLWEKW
jgi:outer membrane protein TolC